MDTELPESYFCKKKEHSYSAGIMQMCSCCTVTLRSCGGLLLNIQSICYIHLTIMRHFEFKHKLHVSLWPKACSPAAAAICASVRRTWGIT